MAGVVGDFEKLRGIRNTLRRFKDGDFARRLKKNLAQEALRLAQQSFDRQQDPYGRSWKPSSTTVNANTLSGTGNLRNSLHEELTSSGFRIISRSRYARIHQFGGTILPKRGEYLVFKIATSARIASKRGGWKRLNRPHGGLPKDFGFQWVKVKKVVMPRRQYLPVGNLGGIWAAAFREVIDDLLKSR